MDKKTRFLVSAASLVILVLGTVIGIMLVQGFTFDTKTNKVIQTGVLVVNSVPNGAQIFIDDRYQDITNTSISYLPSKKYKIQLKKEGYVPWEKELEIDNKIITEVEAILWPAIPSVNPVTTTGAINLKASPDGLKAAYGVRFNEQEKAGLWIIDMAKRTVFSGASTEFTQIARNTNALDFSTADYVWSPDSKQILVTLQENKDPNPRFQRNYILDTTRLNNNPSDITLTKEGILETWLEEWNTQENTRLQKLVGDAQGERIASNSAIPIRWSWDNTMFLYAEASSVTNVQSPTSQPRIIPIRSTRTSTEAAVLEQNESTSSSQMYRKDIEALSASVSATMKVKVYDVKKKTSYDLPHASYYSWYPAEEKADRAIQHLIMVEDNAISMIETDGKNKSTLYSGPYEKGRVFPWPDGGRLVFLTNFNAGAGSEPNLYTINLR